MIAVYIKYDTHPRWHVDWYKHPAKDYQHVGCLEKQS